MSVVAVAISVSFHLRSAPSALEQRLARPLGLIFWLLSVACLLAGLGNYIKTVNKYSRKVAIVQSGWRTQVRSFFPGMVHKVREIEGRKFGHVVTRIDALANHVTVYNVFHSFLHLWNVRDFTGRRPDTRLKKQANLYGF